MKKVEIDTNHFSVLNTDTFDRRRFQELFELSNGLQQLTQEAALPTFEPLLSDLWASFYKMKPAIIAKEVDGFLAVNKLLMEVTMADPHFITHRKHTRLNDVAAVISAIQFGGKMNQWIAEQLTKDEDLQEQLLEIDLQQMGETKDQVADANSQVDGRTELSGRLQQTILENHDSLMAVMGEARQEAKQVENGVMSLLGGLGAGKGVAELKNVPLRDKLALAEKIASTKKMQDIAEWAGRFKEVAHQKQKAKQSESAIRRGITIGSDIENLLPAELAHYTHPLMKMDFLRRFAEGQTMQFEQEAPLDLKKGPIVLCLDQSDSMRGLETQSKGFTLALLSIAKKQGRDLCLILFSTRIQILNYKKGKMGASEMARLARTFLGGGTNYAQALEQAIAVISESRFKQADVVFMTDGEDRLTDSFLETFHKKKRKKGFNVLSLVIGCNSNTVQKFTDRVIEVTDFDNQGSFTAFEI